VRGTTTEQLVRFALVGGVNTLVTGALVALLAQAMDPRLAFAIAFLLGVVANTLATGRLVFRTTGTVGQGLAYATWYVLVFLVGLFFLAVIGAQRGSASAGLVVLITAPMGFLGARWVFGSRDVGAHAKKEGSR
jgi:putative flippase GtrA